MDFRILQLQWIEDSSIFWARILDFACNQSIFARISDSGQMEGGIWLMIIMDRRICIPLINPLLNFLFVSFEKWDEKD